LPASIVCISPDLRLRIGGSRQAVHRPERRDMKVNLRKKTLIIIGAGLVCLILVLYASSQMVLTKSLREIENRDMRENVERALDAISIDQMRLSNHHSLLGSQKRHLLVRV
jgi:hypothetical protein